MILSGKQIHSNIITGDISISPYSQKRLNSNSYNLSLHKNMLVYTNELDVRIKNQTRQIVISDAGYLLQPGELYLCRTNEKIASSNHIGQIDGRSSIARLGICVHLTAGIGSVGFDGYWTLEVTCVKPVRIYADIEICQMYFHEIKGPFIPYTNGKYQHNEGIQSSKLYLELDNHSINNTTGDNDDDKERDIKEISTREQFLYNQEHRNDSESQE